MMQDLMSMVNEGVESREEQLKNGWEVYHALAPTHWIKFGEKFVSDHLKYGDAGFYDLFLHKQDRAYDIDELYEFIEKEGGLYIVDFIEADIRRKLSDLLLPEDDPLRIDLESRDKIERQAIAELMHGDMIKHAVYVSKKPNTEADFDDLDNIPFYFGLTKGSFMKITKAIIDEGKKCGKKVLTYQVNGPREPTGSWNFTIPLSKYSPDFAKLLLNSVEDGKTLGELYKSMMSVHEGVTMEKLQEDFKKTFGEMKKWGHLLLRDKKVNPKPVFPEVYGDDAVYNLWLHKKGDKIE